MTTTLTAADVQPTALQRRSMRFAVTSSCFVAPLYLSVTHGLLLLYFTAQHISSAGIMFMLAIPPLADALLRVPMAHLSERLGKKRVGTVGTSLEGAGITVVAIAGFWEPATAQALSCLGVAIFSVGTATMQASWFALLSPLIPEPLRGRFFGTLRTSWQTISIILAAICAFYLTEQTPVRAFQIVLGSIALMQVGRIAAYLGIAELEAPNRQAEPIRRVVADVMRADGFMSFCAYVFLLTLVTANTPVLFALVEKRVLNLGDNLVVWLGILGMLGALAGFYIGGKSVDRFGAKPVFLICHPCYSLVLLAFILRGRLGIHPVAVAAAANLAFGLVWAASSIAISTELLALIPPTNKSVSTSICMVLMRGGAAVAGLLIAWILDLGALTEHWRLWRSPVSAYDTIMLGCAVTVLLLVVTLGLVPSVMRKAEWIPRQV